MNSRLAVMNISLCCMERFMAVLHPALHPPACATLVSDVMSWLSAAAMKSVSFAVMAPLTHLMVCVGHRQDVQPRLHPVKRKGFRTVCACAASTCASTCAASTCAASTCIPVAAMQELQSGCVLKRISILLLSAAAVLALHQGGALICVKRKNKWRLRMLALTQTAARSSSDREKKPRVILSSLKS